MDEVTRWLIALLCFVDAKYDTCTLVKGNYTKKKTREPSEENTKKNTQESEETTQTHSLRMEKTQSQH
jgi:hypothetical protein